MRPVLFHIGKFPVFAYSLCAVLAFFAGLAYTYYEARRVGEDPDKVLDLSAYMFVFGIIGARIMFIITKWDYFSHDPKQMLYIWRGGLVYYGGLIMVVLVCVAFIRYHKLSLPKWADLLAPSAMITLIFGRIGCFMNGCCYGKLAPDLPWGVVYPSGHQALGMVKFPVHPTQLYASFMALVIFLILVVISRLKHRNGLVFWCMLLLYSLNRFALEFYRGDKDRGMIESLGLSTSQFISVIAGGFALIALVYMRLYRGQDTAEGAGDSEPAEREALE